MRENKYQAKIIKLLESMFPTALILKNDPQYRQGIPDITIFNGDRWAMLEVKASSSASEGPNQAHYVDKLSKMSFAAFIYPENEAEVLRELQSALRPRRKARVS